MVLVVLRRWWCWRRRAQAQAAGWWSGREAEWLYAWLVLCRLVGWAPFNVLAGLLNRVWLGMSVSLSQVGDLG